MLPCTAKTQSECGTEVPTEWAPALLQQVKAIQQYAPDRSAERIVPVRFTSIQSETMGSELTQAQATAGLANLNAAFVNAGFNFVQCGDITYIKDDRIYGTDISDYMSSFSYTSGALEIYVGSPGIVSSSHLPCPVAYLAGNPNFVTNCDEHTNFIRVTVPSVLTTSGFVHEAGHQFGLLHTFFNPAPYSATTPYPPDQAPAVFANLDYPYRVYDDAPTNQHVWPSWWGRELVIKVDEDPQTTTKPFRVKNWDIAGDLVEDTNPDCVPGLTTTPVPSIPPFYPGCPHEVQSGNCAINTSLLTYKDYNGDPVIPVPAGQNFGRNFMSYWKSQCRNEFSPLQIDRAIFFYDTERSPRYTTSLCGNFSDIVELRNTSIGLEKVNVRIRYDGLDHKTNAISKSNGKFSGVLHQDKVKSYVYRNGKTSELLYAINDPKTHYNHKPCEWREGIDALDLIQINRFVLGLSSTLLSDGYSRIAGDANNDGKVTLFDMLELRKLILGQYNKLPEFDQPWRFVPEFIPQFYAAAFAADPFVMSLDQGTTTFSAPKLCEGTYQYAIPNPSGSKGFDGVHIGDVNNTWTPYDNTCLYESAIIANSDQPELTVPNQLLAEDETIKISVRAKNFTKVIAFQLGMNIPYDYFDFSDVKTNDLSLPGYSKEDNFGLNHLDNNEFRTLWYASPDADPLTLADGEELFSLEVSTKQSVLDLSALLKLDNAVLLNKVWQSDDFVSNGKMPKLEIVIESKTETGARSDQSIESLQALTCRPNPTKEDFILTFHNKVPEKVFLKITDLSGKVVSLNSIQAIPGENNATITDLRNQPAGRYLIELQTNNQTLHTQVIKQ